MPISDHSLEFFLNVFLETPSSEMLANPPTKEGKKEGTK